MKVDPTVTLRIPPLKDTPPFQTEIFWELKIFIKENQYKTKCLRIHPPFDFLEIGEKGGVSLVLPWDHVYILKNISD